MNRMTIICVLMTLGFCLWFSNSALADRTVTGVTLNGGSVTTVVPEGTINVEISVLTTNGWLPWPLFDYRWRTTGYRIDGGPEVCVNTANYNNSAGTYSETFGFSAPLSAGTYSIEFRAYRDNLCRDGASSPYTMTNAITVAPPGLSNLSYYFDELGWNGTSGEVIDSSGNGYDGTGYNGATTAIESPALPGNPGTCEYGVFDGDNDYVGLPAEYPNLMSDFTITAWIRTNDNTRAGQRIFIDDMSNLLGDDNDPEGIGLSLGDGGTGRVRFYSRTTNPIYIDTDAATPLQNDTWYFIAAVADISNQRKSIYVFDQAGNQVTSVALPYTGGWGSDPGDASIGGENDLSREGSFYFDGHIDEVKVHQGALDAAAISSIQFEVHQCLARPVAEYRFDQCTELDFVKDDSGNMFDGTVINGPIEIGAGRVCNAAIFDGIDDYIQVDDEDKFDDTEVLTISGWMNPLSIRNAPPTGNARGIISKRNAPTDQAAYGIFFYSERKDGKLYVDLDTDNNRFTSNAVIPEDTWTHFTMVFDGRLPMNERAKLYINGVLDRTAPETSARIPGYSSNVYIGNLYYGPTQLKVFKGLLDEISISRTALTAEEVKFLYESSDRGGCQVCSEDPLDHLRIEHVASGLTCSTSEVVLRACADSDCALEYSDPVYFTMTPVTGQPGWIGGADGTMVDGSAYIDLRQTTPATVTLGVTNISPLPDNGYVCYENGVPGDCDIIFYDSGFVFDVPDHVSASVQNVTLAAVRKDDTSEQCVPGFANVSRRLNFQSNYINPSRRSLPVTINGTAIGVGGTGVNLSFNGNGETRLAVKYADVGQLYLSAGYSGSAANEDAGLVMSGEDLFITRPDHFTLTVPGNPAATDAFGSVFLAAGSDFKVEVSARNADDNVTPNYGIETVPESVSLTSALVAPAGQHNPALVGSFSSFGTDCDGASGADGYACGTFSWPEVGIMTLEPQVKDGSYLDTGNALGDVSDPVGRFIPAYFSLSETSSPEFFDACGSGVNGFTYLGQPFSYLIDPQLRVTALSTGGQILQNYGHDFWKLSSSWTGRSYAHTPANSDLPVSIAVNGGVNLSGQDDYDGIGVFSLNGESVVYAKPVTALEPFATSINLTLAASDLTDSDGACYDVGSDGDCDSYTFSTIGDTQQRYGHLLLQNAYGPETLPLAIPAVAEYFTSGGYVLNLQDSCTVLNAPELLITENANGLATTPSGTASLSSGIGQGLSLSAPGAGNVGAVDLLYDLDAAAMAWLKEGTENPRSRASFGIYQGNPHLIYTRESVW